MFGLTKRNVSCSLRISKSFLSNTDQTDLDS
jgi:hypothetical protein